MKSPGGAAAVPITPAALDGGLPALFVGAQLLIKLSPYLSGRRGGSKTGSQAALS